MKFLRHWELRKSWLRAFVRICMGTMKMAILPGPVKTCRELIVYRFPKAGSFPVPVILAVPGQKAAIPERKAAIMNTT